MESSETHEPSYYEVALTNRQVLVAFVVLLTCLLGAFLSGVWVGRGAEGTAVASNNPPPPVAAPEPVEQLTFFSGREPGARTAQTPPAPAPAASREPARQSPGAPAAPVATVVEDPATEAMRRTLEAEMEAHREPAAEPAARESSSSTTTESVAAAPTPTEPGARTTRRPAESRTAPVAAAPTAAAPAPAAPAASAVRGSFWIQVYSSSNGVRAQEIATALRRAGFAVLLAELPKAGAPSTHRVRVGPFETRAKAEPTATRLRRDHRLDTWITDTP